MTNKILISIITGLVLSLFNIQKAKATYIREYTEERPLIIVSDWEFPPYEFRNDIGEPDGYNVEVLSKILDYLDIPHRYIMQEWYQATKTFDKREADLIHALSYLYNRRPYVMTQNMITYYRIKAARLSSTKPLAKLNELGANDTLVFKSNDYAALQIKNRKDLKFITEHHSPKDALSGIHYGKYKYYTWGEYPLKLKIKELGLDSIVLDDIDIPTGELRIIGYDKDLIDAIDETYARLEQSGELASIHDKWFHPERTKNNESPIALIILLGSVIMIIIAFLMGRLIRSRVQTAIHKSLDLNQMMTQALSMGNYYVIEYDIKTKQLKNIYGNLLPKQGMNIQEYKSHILVNERKEFNLEIDQMTTGKAKQWSVSHHWNRGTAESPDWRYIEGHTILEKMNGKPRYLINTFKDLTQEIKEEQINLEMGVKHQQMFETNLVAMSFYTKEGNLIDVNKRMRDLCGFANPEVENYFRKENMMNAPLIKNQFNPDSHENFHVCHHMFFPEIGVDKYIEFKISPVLDNNGVLQYYVVTSLDLTAERSMHLEQRKHAREIHKKNETINQYEEQLLYLLENSQMYVWRSNLNTKTISYSRSLRNIEYEETLEEYHKSMYEDEQKSSTSAIADSEAMSKPFNIIHHFRYTRYSDHPVWLAISGIPTYTKTGERIGYFGIARNITKLIEVQQKLKEETERAENSGKMKSAFLANMTHEIRTPLNAIVGFSDLLPVVDTNEERMEFIRIIRNNCDMLMRLINDILEASNMGQALAVMPNEVDLAKSFDDLCQVLAQRVQEIGIEFIKDNPYDSFPATVDIGRIQQVLTNFTTNAVKYTKEGHIKVGYREQDGGIYFYCEDTGTGIPLEKQSTIFERFVKLNDFVQGTGLGLSICKSIAERCGGKVGVYSEGEGHGSTFWFWIPKIINIKEDETHAKK